jgi:hypothetical protein
MGDIQEGYEVLFDGLSSETVGVAALIVERFRSYGLRMNFVVGCDGGFTIYVDRGSYGDLGALSGLDGWVRGNYGFRGLRVVIDESEGVAVEFEYDVDRAITQKFVVDVGDPRFVDVVVEQCRWVAAFVTCEYSNENADKLGGVAKRRL